MNFSIGNEEHEPNDQIPRLSPENMEYFASIEPNEPNDLLYVPEINLPIPYEFLRPGNTETNPLTPLTHDVFSLN